MDRESRANTQGHHTDRARGQQASTNRSGMGARPAMARATPRTPALLPARVRQRDGPRQGEPPPHWPRRSHRRGERRTGPPPPTPAPGAGTPQTRRPAPRGANSPEPGRGETAPPPPPQETKRTTGPRQDTRRGTDRVEQPYQCPASGSREVHAPHQPGEGGARTPLERERTHTQRTRGENQKGDRTELAERTDRMEWRISERG